MAASPHTIVGRSFSDRSYTQAIVFELVSGRVLVLDKGPWFSETVSINRGAGVSDLISDTAGDWEDDPDEPLVHHVWAQTFVRV